MSWQFKGPKEAWGKLETRRQLQNTVEVMLVRDDDDEVSVTEMESSKKYTDLIAI